MAQKIEIISNAMVLIGASPISSINEGTEGIVGEALYENTYRALIANHSWRFATKQKQLSRLTTAPLQDFKYKYQIPSDCVVVVRTIDNSDYEIYADNIYSDNESLFIEYRYRVDETLLPAHYVLALQFLLAAQFAIPITDNSQRAAVYEALYEKQLARAKYIDSSSRPSTPIVHSPLTSIN